MLINRLQDSTEFQKLDLPKDYLKDLSENSTDELLGIIAKVTASMLRHLDVPEDEVTEFAEQVKERKMAELFENFVNNLDMSSMYKIALERSKWKAMKEGEAKGREIGLAEGEARGLKIGLAEGEKSFAKLTHTLLVANRLDDLKRAISDVEYRNKLYQEKI